MNTIKVTAAGGAGISLADKVIKNVGILGDGFSNIDIKYIDTSKADISKIEHNPEDFFLVKSSEFSKSEIMGSGAERKTNVGPIVESTKVFLDKNKYLKPDPTEYHLVLFSASGGTGSVLGSILVNSLMERDIPVIALMIGDSSNALSAINTINTIAGLNSMAVKNNKPLSVMYVNNNDFIEDGALSGVMNANKAIFNAVSVLSLFLSGENESIDNQDMINIIDQSKYSTIKVKPGLYGLTTFSKEVMLQQGVIPTVARTLTTKGISPDINVKLLHHKAGIVTSENVIEIFGDQYPLHIVSAANQFTIENEKLKSITDEYYNMMDGIVVNDIVGSEKATEDDNGLIL